MISKFKIWDKSRKEEVSSVDINGIDLDGRVLLTTIHTRWGKRPNYVRFEDIFINADTRTKLINDLILESKKDGWSTKGISDKWHTFEELYYHRMILFLALQKCYPKQSWKSKQHHDGTMFEDSFIVGIETEEGQYSYHYNLKYWDMFKDIKELEKAPEYDGHKPEDIERLLNIGG